MARKTNKKDPQPREEEPTDGKEPTPPLRRSKRVLQKGDNHVGASQSSNEKAVEADSRDHAPDEAKKRKNPASTEAKAKDEDVPTKRRKTAKAQAIPHPVPNDTKAKHSSKPSVSAPDAAPQEPQPSSPKYWLLKAEPDSRLENGLDVKFSIDDLKACTRPEPWEGVRNHVAKKNMMAMRKGELGFFYHSNTKVPGIAGIMEIVGESSVDESAFDPKHPYHDPKSTDREKPRWFNVHVGFERKFPGLISLKELQGYKGPGEALEDMQLLKQSRLSVSKVSEREWKFIMGLAEKMEEDGGNVK